MIKSSCYLTIGTLLLTSWLPVSAFLEIGAPIPKADEKLRDISGQEVTLSSVRKKNGLLVIFSGNQCPYVIRNQQRTLSICNYALKNNIGVVLVNANEALRADGEALQDMKAYAVQQQYNWYYVLDKNAVIADAFDANHTPECFLFNQSGKLVYKGGIDDNPGNETAVQNKYLQTAINHLLSGKTPGINTTNSLGCSIKRQRN
jgi:thioredoxin-related protein